MPGNLFERPHTLNGANERHLGVLNAVHSLCVYDPHHEAWPIGHKIKMAGQEYPLCDAPYCRRWFSLSPSEQLEHVQTFKTAMNERGKK